MQRVTLEAKTTATDQELGTFTAIVSAWDADREKDVIERTAFDATIAAWQGSGKKLPLLFEHSTTVVGAIDPASMYPTEQGLVVSGEVDRTEAEGRQVWRSVKAGTAGFSIGFMSKSKPRKGGGRTLTEIDLLELSATSTPVHPSARILDWKSTRSLDEKRYGLPDGRVVDYKGLLAYTEARSEIERKKAQPIQIVSFRC